MADKGSPTKAVQVPFPWKGDTHALLSSPFLQPHFSGKFFEQLFFPDPVCEQTAFLRHLIDRDLDFIFVKDRRDTFVLGNRSLTEAYGTTLDDLRGKGDADFNADPSQSQKFAEDDRNVLESKKELVISAEQFTDITGQTRTFRTIKVPILDSEGNATHVLGIATDITLEHELSRPRQSMASPSDKSPNGAEDADVKFGNPSRRKSAPTILVVDDDEDVSEVTRELLEGAGYQVVVALDGLQGLQEYLRHEDSVKLVILDVAMPKADGEEMLRQLRKVSPALPVIVCSGYAESNTLKRMMPEQFFAKPYDPKKLLQSVQLLLRP